MQNLEEKLKEIFLENQKLKSENNSLKEKINLLSIEVSFLVFKKKKKKKKLFLLIRITHLKQTIHHQYYKHKLNQLEIHLKDHLLCLQFYL
jgi:hypothetical protein